MTLELKGIETIDTDISEVFEHELLMGTTDASHHVIYHYRGDEVNADIFVPTFGKETEPFGWNFNETQSLSDTPSWFQARVRIGRALWDNAIMESMSYKVVLEVLNDLEKQNGMFFNDLEKVREYMKHQMNLIKYYEQFRFVDDNLKKIFNAHEGKLPYFIYWENQEGESVYFAVYSLNTNQFQPVLLKKEIAKEIEEHFSQANRDQIKTQTQANVIIADLEKLFRNPDDLLGKAEKFATEAHKHQFRKTTGLPMITHPIEVAQILKDAGFSPETVAAGFLHDVVEDTPYELEDIEREFGSEVARIVAGNTEEKQRLDENGKWVDVSWEERKEHTIEGIKKAPLEIKALTVADKLSNLKSVIQEYELIGDEVWTYFKRGKGQQKWYFSSIAENCAIGLKTEEVPPFFKEYQEKVKAFFDQSN